MKFEPASTASEPAGADDPACSTTRFTLEQTPFAGQTFSAVFRICDNPCCRCEVVGLECRPETAAEQVLRFDVEAFDRQLTRQAETAPDAVALGRAFVAEARDSDWDWLGRLFLSAKLEAMEAMDLDKLDADLPADVKAGQGTMVGYAEVFPWADRFAFTLEGETWVVGEQYCVAPGCTCTEIGLGFFRSPARERRSREPVRASAYLFHDYRTGGVRVEDLRAGTPRPEQLMQALRAAYPKLAEMLRHRHAQMQQLGRRLMPKARRRRRWPLSYLLGDGQEVEEPAPASPAPAKPPAPKVGRNVPCPCGSGKKYKKCCGAA